MAQTKFLLDSGDPDEFREIAQLAKKNGTELWGATTNPTLIAKKLSSGPLASPSEASKKFTQQEAFELQKQIVLEITEIVPGAVSAEVYADAKTSAEEMVEQGRQIDTWHERVVVKLPTTVQGFKARTILRRENIPTNNTLVFSQEQIFAVCLHEQLMQQTEGPVENLWPPFISPFVGRLDDIGEDGMHLVEQGMRIKQLVDANTWMLEASVRRAEHLKRGILANVEIITAPAKVYREWFAMPAEQREAIDTTSYAQTLTKPVPYEPGALTSLETIEDFIEAIESGTLNIQHDLTTKGLVRFSEDWKAIIAA